MHFDKLTPKEISNMVFSDESGDLHSVPSSLSSYDNFYRLRRTMLEAMGSAAPGDALDIKRLEFFLPFKEAINLPTLQLMKAEWDYLTQMRGHLRGSLQSVFRGEAKKMRFEAAHLLNAFAKPYHRRRERIDFGLLESFVVGFSDHSILTWLKKVSEAIHIEKAPSFFQRLRATRRILQLQKTP